MKSQYCSEFSICFLTHRNINSPIMKMIFKNIKEVDGSTLRTKTVFGFLKDFLQH